MNKWKVIKYNKRIEELLTKKYQASGKGLHSKLTSVESKLAPELVKQIRFIATIRNKLVHEADYNNLPKDFIKTNKAVIKELSYKKESVWSWVVFFLLLLLLAFLMYLRFRNGFS